MASYYLPSLLTTIDGLQPVIRAESFPPHQHPERCPIVPEMTVVRATLANGAYRWFGCDAARIDSTLRMVLDNPRLGELLKTWRKVKA